MKFTTRLSIFLILTASIFFAVKFSSAKEVSNLNSLPADKYPYKIVEVLPGSIQGGQYIGVSDKNELINIASDLGADPYEKDKFTVFPDLKMQMGGTITIYRTPSFSILDGKRSYAVRSWAKTVGELLTENNIELGEDDKINFSTDTELFDAMQIKIIRVAVTTVVERENIEYQVVKKSDPNLEKGNKRVEVRGSNGTRAKYYLVTREDGVEISKVFQKNEMEREPVTEVVVLGTKVVSYGTGVASIWKSSGEMVAACNFVAKGTIINVVNLDNKKSVTVTCMGGGLRSDRIVDLSSAAFQALGGSWSQGLLKNVRAEKYYPNQD